VTGQSSGDLSADRRYLWAEASRKDGDLAAAADLYRQAIEIAPDWPAAWFGLGETLAALGEPEPAKEAFGVCLGLAPGDPFGASLHLARLTGDTTDAMPAAYVTRLFDDYADRFESHLVDTLDYRGPAILLEALEQTAPAARFEAVCDLGCGTGLMARALAWRAGAIDGIDLSPNMVAHAERTGLYRRLLATDCLAGLATLSGAYDLIVAADVFVYLGDLAPVLAAARARTRDGGWMAFTVQALPEPTATDAGFALGPDLRYAHSTAYLVQAARDACWTTRLLAPAVTRRDAGRDVPGLVVVLSCDGA